MSNYAEKAKELAAVMLTERRKLVDGIITHGRRSTDDYARLSAIHDTITLAEYIMKDERGRAAAEEYRQHEAAGTLVDDGYGSKIVPTA